LVGWVPIYKITTTTFDGDGYNEFLKEEARRYGQPDNARAVELALEALEVAKEAVLIAKENSRLLRKYLQER
jgi:hypothetical protein